MEYNISGDYYIYVYIDQYNIPFYVGKGIKDRYKISCHINQQTIKTYLKNKINKLGKDNIKIALLHQNLSEEQANLYEKVWIKLIGRRDLRLGPLCNLTNGGDGISGYFHSEKTKEKIQNARSLQVITEETRKKMSQAHKGHKCSEEQIFQMTQRKHSEETKRKMSQTHKMCLLKGAKNNWSGKRTIEHQLKINESLRKKRELKKTFNLKDSK